MSKRKNRTNPADRETRHERVSNDWHGTNPTTSTRALNRFFLRERGRLISSISNRFRFDEATSSDVVHDAYLKCLQATHGERSSSISEVGIETVFWTAAQRKGIDYLRHFRRSYVASTNVSPLLATQMDRGPGSLEILIQAELTLRLSQAISSLSDAESKLLRLRILQGRSRKEIADELRCCERTVTSKVSRVLERIRKSTPFRSE